MKIGLRWAKKNDAWVFSCVIFFLPTVSSIPKNILLFYHS